MPAGATFHVLLGSANLFAQPMFRARIGDLFAPRKDVGDPCVGESPVNQASQLMPGRPE